MKCVLCVPSPWPLSRDDHPVRRHGKVANGINPWKYVSGGPVNNAQADLWAEYVVGDEVWVISNWKSEPFPKAQLSRYYKRNYDELTIYEVKKDADWQTKRLAKRGFYWWSCSW